ncbi:phosphatidate cytidylyltransferase [Croceicoccus sp. F390]|uniref:Phosphatidate cytidylyltransferase n=1 Tax=Croceicoccus esteveae TaxID=3075597 RepID=A0ABU2ZJJ6_9SPHN|nr:phosphatidate cytidylyltransferase [Croceicoccus sp. F390]MDT0576570.1 phosphatidate cytidylyltransferase [Croceicoccus sp. F390]
MADADPVRSKVRAQGARNTDLPVRLTSAVLMLAIAGFALWRGGWILDALVLIVAAATFWEWARLVRRWPVSTGHALAWLAGGALYIGAAAVMAVTMPAAVFVFALGVAVMTDTCAYLAGRTIGGPKIAPRISPSKTWAGLLGGMIGAALWCCAAVAAHVAVTTPAGGGASVQGSLAPYGVAAMLGALLAIAAQAGDFFESWMKRRALVKDSSRLIPGHGGIFDRTDGLLPVLLIVGVLYPTMMQA